MDTKISPALLNGVKTNTRSESRIVIVNALFSLLLEKEFKKITVKEIIEKSAISRRTFYRYFTGKEDVLDCGITYLIEDYVNFEAQSPFRSLHNVSFKFFSYWKTKIKVVRILIDNKLTVDFSRKLVDSLTLTFAGQEKNIFRNPDLNEGICKDSNNEVHPYSLIFAVGGYISLLIKWINDGAKVPPKEMADIVVEFFKCAINVTD